VSPLQSSGASALRRMQTSETTGVFAETGHPIPSLGGRWLGARNGFVIGIVGGSRTIAHNAAKDHALLSTLILSTLIEACASERRGSAISTQEQSDV
jgi:hypothetical protein